MYNHKHFAKDITSALHKASSTGIVTTSFEWNGGDSIDTIISHDLKTFCMESLPNKGQLAKWTEEIGTFFVSFLKKRPLISDVVFDSHAWDINAGRLPNFEVIFRFTFERDPQHFDHLAKTLEKHLVEVWGKIWQLALKQYPLEKFGLTPTGDLNFPNTHITFSQGNIIF